MTAANNIQQSIGDKGPLPDPPSWQQVKRIADDPQYSRHRHLFIGHLQIPTLTKGQPTILCKASTGDGNCFFNAISLNLYSASIYTFYKLYLL
jgi:hypothetical protein